MGVRVRERMGRTRAGEAETMRERSGVALVVTPPSYSPERGYRIVSPKEGLSLFF